MDPSLRRFLIHLALDRLVRRRYTLEGRFARQTLGLLPAPSTPTRTTNSVADLLLVAAERWFARAEYVEPPAAFAPLLSALTRTTNSPADLLLVAVKRWLARAADAERPAAFAPILAAPTRTTNSLADLLLLVTIKRWLACAADVEGPAAFAPSRTTKSLADLLLLVAVERWSARAADVEPPPAFALILAAPSTASNFLCLAARGAVLIPKRGVVALRTSTAATLALLAAVQGWFARAAEQVLLATRGGTLPLALPPSSLPIHGRKAPRAAGLLPPSSSLSIDGCEAPRAAALSAAPAGVLLRLLRVGLRHVGFVAPRTSPAGTFSLLDILLFHAVRRCSVIKGTIVPPPAIQPKRNTSCNVAIADDDESLISVELE